MGECCSSVAGRTHFGPPLANEWMKLPWTDPGLQAAQLLLACRVAGDLWLTPHEVAGDGTVLGHASSNSIQARELLQLQLQYYLLLHISSSI